MRNYTGHEHIREALERELPLVTVLTGPASVGKRTLAGHVLAHHQVGLHSTLWLERSEVSIGAVRGIVLPFVSTAPSGAFKVVVLDLEDAPALAGVQEALLKTLEEPPPGARFILVSSRPLLPTILSRASVFRFGVLTDDQVVSVLCLTGVAPIKARAAAAVAGGAIRPALTAVKGAGEARARVVDVLREVARGVPPTAREWGEYEHRLLSAWAVEKVTDRWRVFTRSDVPGLHAEHARRLLALLSAAGSARVRIADWAALEDLAGGIA